MQILKQLEDKIVTLLELVATQKKENEALKKKIDMLESSMLDENNRLEKLNKEKELTKTVVDDLIKNIDSLVEGAR